jgi:hypothetical protein
MSADSPLWGLLAEFETPGELVSAVRRTRAEGYEKVDAFTPYPVEDLPEALGLGRSRLPLLVLLGGMVGAAGGFLMQYYLSVIDYPLNVGGRPLNSWPAFIVITFEMTILFAALSSVLGMLALNGLPTPYHPVFNAPQFALASRNRLFLSIEASDPRFEPQATRKFMAGLKPREVVDVAS